MNAECHFHNVPFNSIIPSLKYGKYDAAASAMNITAARSQQVDFTQPYLPDEVGTVGFIATVAQRRPLLRIIMGP